MTTSAAPAVAGPATAPALAAADPRPVQTRPAAKDQPPPRATQLTWQEYRDPIVTKDARWHKDVGELLRPIAGGRLVLQPDKYGYALDGPHALGLLPDEGRMLRLGIAGGECSLEFWNGRHGVRIDFKDKGPLAGYTLAQPDRRRPPEIRSAFDDGGTWQWYRKGLIDVRYQDRQIVVCRGDLPLLSVPMPKPPDEGSLSAKAVLRLAALRPAEPLAFPADPPAPLAKPNWERPSPPGGKPPVGVKFTAGPRGEATLTADGARTIERAGFEIATAGGVEVVFHVRRALPGTGLYAGAPGRQLQLWLVLHNDRNIVVTLPGHQGMASRNAASGFAVGSQFWCRVRYGLDFEAMSFSRDGTHWSTLHDRPIRADQALPQQVGLGIQVAAGRGRRSIHVDSVRIRRFEALSRLGGGKLPAQGPVGERVAAAMRLIEAAARRSAPAEHHAVLAAIDDLRRIARLRTDAALRSAVRAAFEEMGRTSLEAGDIEGMRTLLQRSYLRRVPPGLTAPTAATHVAPPKLLRLYLLDLVARRRWRTLRLDALRHLYLARDGAGEFGKDPPDRDAVALARWALARADARFRADDGPAPAAPDLPARWTHPLAHQPHRLTSDVMNEFLVLVKDKNYPAACRALVRHPLPNRLIRPSPGDALLPSSHFQARQTIRNVPELRAILREKHADVGMVRMTRARRDNDVEAMKSVAAQFYSTEAGFEAKLALADLDLARGGFSTAAADYKALAGEKGYSQRRGAAIKYRLASAMLGRFAGAPPAETVVLSAGTFSAEEFETMIQRLVREHGTRPSTGPAALAPGPKAGKMSLASLAATTGSAKDRDGAFGFQTAFAADARRLFVHHRGKLLATDLQTGQALWTYEPAFREPDLPAVGGSGPLRAGKKLYARFLQDGRWTLTCFNPEGKKPLWSNAYGGQVVSDPILIDGRLYVIAARPAPDGEVDLHLQGVHPDGGEASLSTLLLRVRDVPPAVGRPAVVDGGIVFRASGCLVHCDLRGEVRWVRRLPVVPPDVSPRLYEQMPSDDMLGRDSGDVIFAAAGCPQVMCVNVATGKLRWSKLFGEPVRVVGSPAGGVVIAEAAAIRALDPATGKTLWRQPGAAGIHGVLAAEGDTVACVLLDTPDPRRTGPPGFRGIRWRSAKDGRVAREIAFAPGPLHGVAALFTDGKRIFGLAGVDAKRASGRLFAIRP